MAAKQKYPDQPVKLTVSQARKIIYDLQGQVSLRKAGYDSLLEDHHGALDTKAKVEAKNEALRKELDYHKTMAAERDKTANKLGSRVTDLNIEMKSLLRDNSELTVDLKAAEKELSDLRKDHAQMTDTIEGLKRRLADITDSRQSALSDRQSMAGQLQGALSALERLGEGLARGLK